MTAQLDARPLVFVRAIAARRRPHLLGEVLVVLSLLRDFGMDDYYLELSTRETEGDKKDKFIGSDDQWELATEVLRDVATESGLELVLDPGLGFAKTAEHNWALLQRLDALAALGRPLLIGASRKAFLGALLDGRPPEGRDAATAAITVLAAQAADDEKKYANPMSPAPFDGKPRDAEQRGQTMSIVSGVTFGVAVVGIAGAVALYYLGKKIDREAKRNEQAFIPGFRF